MYICIYIIYMHIKSIYLSIYLSISISVYLSIYVYIYIYILKRHYKDIEKSILHKKMMVTKNENLKNPCISILTC